MSRKRGATVDARSGDVVAHRFDAPASPAQVVAVRVAFGATILALLGTAWVVDPFALAAFDAPKQLLALLAAAAGAIVLPCLPWPMWSRCPAAARWLVLLVGASGVGMLVATFVSPHRAVAWDALRSIVLFALLLPLGASAALDGRRGRRVLGVALLAVGVNALLSLLQAAGVSLLPVGQLGGRFSGIGMLGNEGYVALACALGAAACLALGAWSTASRTRLLAAGIGGLCVVAIIVNRQATAAIALCAALGMLAALRWRAWWLPLSGAALLVVAVLAATVPVLRHATWSAVQGGSVDALQSATTYRFGAWVAAAAIVAEHPLTGIGPGGFAVESERRRFDAETRLQQRLALPASASTFVNPHQEYLQLAAECGLPTLFAALSALGLLLVRLWRLALASDAVEARLLLAVLVSGAVAALAWFPLQIPFVAVMLLLVCGRAWRLVAEAAPTTETNSGSVDTRRIVFSAIAAVAAVALVWPTLTRYRAEWQLGEANTRLQRALLGVDRGDAALASVQRAAALARDASAHAPNDQRADLLLGTALLLQRQVDAATDVFERSIARGGERPELVLNLGRTRAARDDAAGADAAYLRAAWLSDVAVDTLPKAMRERLRGEVTAWDARLRSGARAQPPLLQGASDDAVDGTP